MGDLWAGVEAEAARRLLRGAVGLFAAKGYGGASTREIAESAGMSPAAMYVHFATKAELLYRIVGTVHEAAHAAVAEVGNTTVVERVRAMVFALAAFHAAHQQAARVTQNELAALDSERWGVIRDLRDATEGLFLRQVELGVRAGVFDVADVPGTTRAIVSMCVDVARWYSPAGPRTPDEIGALYAHLAMRMLAVH
ncbi:TetR/AcrR family transcriptional regulator [Nonomuraea sp. NPDC050556]|uniref:TetR/AcrR family transcriptional regulator n=1 Tax=Nonomuraea sp. NPDC050556 TaxID=3364369 RepID=UPI0037A24526